MLERAIAKGCLSVCPSHSWSTPKLSKYIFNVTDRRADRQTDRMAFTSSVL